jgi:hypothetical protein
VVAAVVTAVVHMPVGAGIDPDLVCQAVRVSLGLRGFRTSPKHQYTTCTHRSALQAWV